MPDKIITLDNLKDFREEIYVGLNKEDVGLGNVDNTSDADKPISTVTQTALNAKQDTLVSGDNIKTVGGQSILGSGDLPISGGTKLYRHIIKFTGSPSNNILQFISKRESKITSLSDLFNELNLNSSYTEGCILIERASTMGPYGQINVYSNYHISLSTPSNKLLSGCFTVGANYPGSNITVSFYGTPSFTITDDTVTFVSNKETTYTITSSNISNPSSYTIIAL